MIQCLKKNQLSNKSDLNVAYSLDTTDFFDTEDLLRCLNNPNSLRRDEDKIVGIS